MNHEKQAGITLIELLIAVVVIGIIASIGAPIMSDMISRNTAYGAAESTYSMMQLAKSEAIRSNSTTYVHFSPGTDWCIGISDAVGNCNCSNPPTAINCSVGGNASKTLTFATFNNSKITIDAGSFNGNNYTSFNPQRGQSTTGTLNFVTGGYTGSVSTTNLGGIKISYN